VFLICLQIFDLAASAELSIDLGALSVSGSAEVGINKKTGRKKIYSQCNLNVNLYDIALVRVLPEYLDENLMV
jgi:hypothetical protein